MSDVIIHESIKLWLEHYAAIRYTTLLQVVPSRPVEYSTVNAVRRGTRESQKSLETSVRDIPRRVLQQGV